MAFMSFVLLNSVCCPVYAANKTELLCTRQQMYSYEDMKKDICGLQKEYEDFLTVSSIGQTVDGREIYELIIGNPDGDKHIFVSASIHAREYITTSLVMMQTEAFLKHVKEDDETYRDLHYSELIKDAAIHIVPMINPDGVSISQFGIDGIKHASVRQDIYRIYHQDHVVEIDPYLRRWKSNAQGIDINRNFDALWDQYNDHLGHPSSDHYKGEKPECTAEAAALVTLTKKYQFDRTISYHAQGGVIYWYFAQEGALLEKSRKFANEISKVTGYPLDADYTKLDPAGYKDWAIQKMEIPSLTIEVGSGGVPVDMAQLPAIYKKNKDVFAETLYHLSVDGE